MKYLLTARILYRYIWLHLGSPRTALQQIQQEMT
jgi:hypothetical protein